MDFTLWLGFVATRLGRLTPVRHAVAPRRGAAGGAGPTAAMAVVAAVFRAS